MKLSNNQFRRDEEYRFALSYRDDFAKYSRRIEACVAVDRRDGVIEVSLTSGVWLLDANGFERDSGGGRSEERERARRASWAALREAARLRDPGFALAELEQAYITLVYSREGTYSGAARKLGLDPGL